VTTGPEDTYSQYLFITDVTNTGGLKIEARYKPDIPYLPRFFKTLKHVDDTAIDKSEKVEICKRAVNMIPLGSRGASTHTKWIAAIRSALFPCTKGVALFADEVSLDSSVAYGPDVWTTNVLTLLAKSGELIEDKVVRDELKSAENAMELQQDATDQAKADIRTGYTSTQDMSFRVIRANQLPLHHQHDELSKTNRESLDLCERKSYENDRSGSPALLRDRSTTRGMDFLTP